MARLTPQQLARRDRFVALIAFAAPVLDAVLSVGGRLTQILGPEDYDYYPIPAPGERLELGDVRPGEPPAE